MPFTGKVTFIATAKVMTIIHAGRRIQFTADKLPQLERIKAMIRAEDEDGIIEYITKGTMIIPEYSKGQFQVNEEGTMLIDLQTSTEVHGLLATRVIEWAKEGYPFQPLLNFHRKLLDNPNRESAEDLYTFMEKNDISLTPEGMLIAYKKVHMDHNGDLWDVRTKSIRNNVGDRPKMDRNLVDGNRNNTCSTGLHVCGYTYLSHYGSGSDVVINVEIHPKDVVSVPKDYNGSKMRVCEYLVIMRSDGKEIKSKLHKVVKTKNLRAEVSDVKAGIEHDQPTEGAQVVLDDHTDVKVHDIDFTQMTAQKIKDYIMEHYNQEITTDNKNKKTIVNKAYKIMEDYDAKNDNESAS